VTAAADIYGLGAVLYELLTGRPPRTVSSLGELGERSSYAVPDVRTQVRGLPSELAEVVMSCLAFEPDQRPASAAAVARQLAAVSADAPTLPLPDDPARRATEILAPRDRESASRRIPKHALAGVLAACALAGGVLAAVLADGGSGPPPAPAEPHVASVPLGANAAVQARNLADWLRRYSGG
jgi:serine/threonine-protein kinase